MEKPAALIRPKVLKSGKRILLERIHPLWSRLKFLQKITLRNMFRYKERLIMMLVGISLPVGALMHYLVMHMIVVENMEFDIHVSVVSYYSFSRIHNSFRCHREHFHET